MNKKVFDGELLGYGLLTVADALRDRVLTFDFWHRFFSSNCIVSK